MDWNQMREHLLTHEGKLAGLRASANSFRQALTNKTHTIDFEPATMAGHQGVLMKVEGPHQQVVWAYFFPDVTSAFRGTRGVRGMEIRAKNNTELLDAMLQYLAEEPK